MKVETWGELIPRIIGTSDNIKKINGVTYENNKRFWLY